MKRKRSAAKATLTTSNAESPFLRLPGEVRNMIYEYLSISGTFSVIRRIRRREKRNSIQIIRLHPNSNHPLGIPLLIVCRQIHRETALLPFKTNSFRFNCFTGFSHMVRMFSKERLAMIKELHLQINWGDSRGDSARTSRSRDDMDKSKIKLAALLKGIKCFKLDIKPMSWPYIYHYKAVHPHDRNYVQAMAEWRERARFRNWVEASVDAS